MGARNSHRLDTANAGNAAEDTRSDNGIGVGNSDPPENANAGVAEEDSRIRSDTVNGDDDGEFLRTSPVFSARHYSSPSSSGHGRKRSAEAERGDCPDDQRPPKCPKSSNVYATVPTKEEIDKWVVECLAPWGEAVEIEAQLLQIQEQRQAASDSKNKRPQNCNRDAKSNAQNNPTPTPSTPPRPRRTGR